jgi:hypothetical protein
VAAALIVKIAAYGLAAVALIAWALLDLLALLAVLSMRVSIESWSAWSHLMLLWAGACAVNAPIVLLNRNGRHGLAATAALLSGIVLLVFVQWLAITGTSS